MSGSPAHSRSVLLTDPAQLGQQIAGINDELGRHAATVIGGTSLWAAQGTLAGSWSGRNQGRLRKGPLFFFVFFFF